jgi:hypothetical protein
MTFRQFTEIARKKPYEPFWASRFFWRHLTIPCSWVCAQLRITADQITVVSLILGMAGGVCYCWPTTGMYVFGTLLVWAWWMLDHMDGELARYEIQHLKHPSTLAGPYLDLLVHRWVQPWYHVGLGVGLLRLTGDWGYVLLGCVAGANFAGFTRTQADALVLPYVVSGSVDRGNQALRELVALAHAAPDAAARKARGIQGLVNLAKWIKTFFGYPGCLVLLAGVAIIDGILLDMNFPRHLGLAWSATLVYLLLQGGMALVQNLAGTWYVASLLRRMP